MTTKNMKTASNKYIEYREIDEEIGLAFKKGIDPKVLIEKIKEIDG